MKTTFGSPATETPASAAPASAADDAQLVENDFFESGFSGEIDQKIIRTPYLSLAHGVGKLAEAGFVPGSLVYNNEVVVAEPKKGILKREDGPVITLLAGFQEYVEEVSDAEFKAGMKARRFRKEQEAKNAGLVTKKEKRASGDESLRAYTPAFQFKVLIEGKPDHGFALEFGGKNYALAALAVTKASFWKAGTVFGNYINEGQILKRPLPAFSFNLWTSLEKFPGSTNAVWVLQAARGPKHSPEFLAWLKDLGV